MENVTEAGSALAMDCYYEEFGAMTEQGAKELVERIIKRGEIEKIEPAVDIKEQVHVELAGLRDAAWRDGKWVPTGNRSSRRKMGVGGKRW